MALEARLAPESRRHLARRFRRQFSILENAKHLDDWMVTRARKQVSEIAIRYGEAELQEVVSIWRRGEQPPSAFTPTDDELKRVVERLTGFKYDS